MKIRYIDFGGQKPSRKHYNDAGADVYAPRSFSIWPGQVLSIPLGFGIELPDGFAGYVFPRTSLASKGLTVELPPIDAGYRGEIHAIVSNVGDGEVLVQAGDRIGQLVIMPCVYAEFVDDLGSERGDGAFGSTNKAG